MVESDGALGHLKVFVNGKSSPDVFDTRTGVWWDVTTNGEWRSHFNRYVENFGDGAVGLIYD